LVHFCIADVVGNEGVELAGERGVLGGLAIFYGLREFVQDCVGLFYGGIAEFT
jgi:hypothetical protein